jgi:hypothetical protein
MKIIKILKNCPKNILNSCLDHHAGVNWDKKASAAIGFVKATIKL